MEPRQRSASASSARSAASRVSSGSAMGPDGGEAGWRAAQEEDLIRRELHDSTAFCNSFWGFSDAGFPVVQNRMKGAARVLDELRAMYKERAEIEADYAKRLQKLARQPLGRDETGMMRSAIDVVRGEVDMMARSHAELSQVFKRDLEGAVAEFNARIQSQRKPALASIERLYKQKATQESYVNKAREKYEQDCFKINGYTAQTSLVQGRDLEKVTSKLDKAQSSVSANERDYQNFVRALKDTTLKWNAEWKNHLDECQDLEEERLDFLKSNLWTYANSISAVCVSDDQSCERVRVALESCESSRDIIDFIQHAGTGNTIPDPPEYIDYSRGKPPPPRPAFRTANFHRSSSRPVSYVPPAAVTESASTAEIPKRRSGGPYNAAQTTIAPSESHEQSIAESSLPTLDAISRETMAGNTVPASESARSRASTGVLPAINTSDSLGGDADGTIVHAPPASRSDKRMSAKNFLAQTQGRGPPGAGNAPNQSFATNVDGPSALLSSSIPQPSAATSTSTSATEADDPLSKALADLRMKPTRSTASNSSRAPPPPSKDTQAESNAPARYYSTTQGSQVGSFNATGSDNRPRSPSAAFMQEPQRATSPVPVEEVISQYGQSFPGERRSLSRQNSTASRNSRYSVQAPSQQAGTNDRARSPGPQQQGGGQGFAGVGARGRSPSPQPFQGHPNHLSQPSMHAQQGGRGGSKPTQMSSSATASGPQRSTTPLGISLDASGSVTHDQMAEDYIRRSGSAQPAPGPPASIVSQSSRQAVQQHPSYQESHAPQAQVQHSHTSTTLGNVSSGAAPQYSAAPQSPAPGPQHAPYQYSGQSGVAQFGYGGSQQPTTQQQGPTSVASPHFRPQQSYDTTGSLGRHAAQNGIPASPYNQRPASATGQAPSHYHSSQVPPAAAASYGAPPNQTAAATGHHPPPQTETPASAYMHQYQQQNQQYAPPKTTTQPPTGHTAAPSSYHPHQQSYHQSQGPSQPQAGWTATSSTGYQNRANAYGSPGGAQYQSGAPMQQSYTHPPQSQSSRTVQQGAGAAQAPSTGPAAASASAPPTGQFSDAGKPILFYVKALYDYHAQLDEEFSFTAGDVIAVWETSPDGWWQGELLDDARRRTGSNTFPSNFVSLLN